MYSNPTLYYRGRIISPNLMAFEGSVISSETPPRTSILEHRFRTGETTRLRGRPGTAPSVVAPGLDVLPERLGVVVDDRGVPRVNRQEDGCSRRLHGRCVVVETVLERTDVVGSDSPIRGYRPQVSDESSGADSGIVVIDVRCRRPYGRGDVAKAGLQIPDDMLGCVLIRSTHRSECFERCLFSIATRPSHCLLSAESDIG